MQAQLIQQVNRQRGTLDEQQERLVRLEHELLEWEERLRRRLDEEREALNRELTQLEERCRAQESQVNGVAAGPVTRAPIDSTRARINFFPHFAQLTDLLDVEDEWHRVRGEGRELADELAKWRTDVTLLDSRLDQCLPTVRYAKPLKRRRVRRSVNPVPLFACRRTGVSGRISPRPSSGSPRSWTRSWRASRPSSRRPDRRRGASWTRIAVWPTSSSTPTPS